MILTGKAKEDFIKHYDNHSIKFLLSWTDFDDLPVIVQNALIIEWFDSVGLYIQVQRHCHPEIVFDSYVLIDTKVFGQSEMSNFEKTVLKDAHSNSNYELDTKVTSNYSYGENNYKLNVELKVK